MRFEQAVVSVPVFDGEPTEDAHVAELDQDVPRAVVVDGHGTEYSTPSDRLEKSFLVSGFASEVAQGLVQGFLSDPDPAWFPQVFDQVNEQAALWSRRLVASPEVGLRSVGAVASLITLSSDTIHLAQSGDCPLYRVTSTQMTRLTQDHHPANPKEAQRLAPFIASGQISLRDYGGVTRVRAPGCLSALQVSRSIGDWALGPAVTHEPECLEIPLDPDSIYILCSDGANDLLQDARDFLTRGGDLEFLAHRLRTHIVWPEDDITIILFRARRS